AEQRHNSELAEELIARVRIYYDGQRLARWDAPASLSVAVSPGAARVKLSRYHRDDADRYALVEPRDLGVSPVGALALPRGSVVLEPSVPGRAPVFYPVLLGRGEQRELALEIPPASAIPPGFVFIAAGEFLFGSADEESIRRKFF